MDDLEQGITDVVRGLDLLDSSAQQIYLRQQLSNKSEPINYWHVPLMREPDTDKKMSKRDGSYSLQEWQAQGRSPQQLIAKLATSLALIDSAQALSADELLAELSAAKLDAALNNA